MSRCSHAIRGTFEDDAVEALSLDFQYWSIFVKWEWEYEQYRDGTLEVLDQPPDLRWRPVVDYYPLMRESFAKHKDSLTIAERPVPAAVARE